MIGFSRGKRLTSKNVTEDYLKLDVRHWWKEGYLTQGRAFNWYWTRDGETVGFIHAEVEADRVMLAYRHKYQGTEWKDECYFVRLDWTPCNYGGKRIWFLCPASGCGRRVAILYGGVFFACRHCHQLAYASQREAAYDRMERRAQKFRLRLGWGEDIPTRRRGKPKGMHWQTFWRLKAEYDVLI